MRNILWAIGLLFILSGCSSMSETEINQKRSELDEMAETAIAGLIKQDSAIQQELDKSLGYAVANMKLTKVPIVGAGGGEGVFYIKETQQRIYFTVSRFDIGGGWGARSYKALMIINDQKVLEKWKTGQWEFQAGVEASAGTVSAEGSSSGLIQGYTLHVLSDGGASATATARIIRIKMNSTLTENL